jgi:hypothetical protein
MIVADVHPQYFAVGWLSGKPEIIQKTETFGTTDNNA